MAPGTLGRFTRSTPAALGILRVVINGVFLISIAATSFDNLGRLPVTLLRPVGVLQLFSWSFYDRLMTSRGMATLKWALLLSLFMSTVGYLTPFSTKLSALLVIFYQGLLRSFGHFNHDEIIGIYFLIVLAFSPCGDAFSVDSWPSNRIEKRPLFVYGYPILLMQLLLAWSYFSSALIKLRVAGFAYFSPDNLPILAIYHSLDNLHDTHFRLAFWLPTIRQYLPFAVGLVLVWELLFPLAVFWKRARWWILGFGVVFHLVTLLLMNFFFAYQLAMYVVFFDWPAIIRWCRRRRVFKGLSSGWRRFRMVPENFPGIRVVGFEKKGMLLWDRECRFCACVVSGLKRIARKPFAESPYQTIVATLPQPVTRWSKCQAYWISEQGEVSGGSTALIDVLEGSGRTMLASFLDTAACRPILWFGVRFVSQVAHKRRPEN